jgi:hypothetical protein
LLRRSLPPLIAVVAVCVAPLSGNAASPAKPSLSAWTKAKQAKVLTPSKVPAKIPGPAKAPPPTPPAAASAGGKSKGKPDGRSDGPPVSGKVAVFGFTGDGAARVQQAVVSTLRTRGLHVTTGLRPVDSAEQYRDMAAALRLAAYIDGSVDGAGSQATVHVRSGMTGRRIASVRFSGEGSALPSDVGNNLWPRTGSQLTRLCAEAAKPRKGGGRVMRINAGTQVEPTVRDDSDVPRHLRMGKRRDDPWADEGT